MPIAQWQGTRHELELALDARQGRAAGKEARAGFCGAARAWRGALDAPRLCGARPRGLHAQPGGAPLGAADRRDGVGHSLAALRGHGGARRTPAAGAPGAAEPAPGRRHLHGNALRPPAAVGQRLCRAARHRRRRANCICCGPTGCRWRRTRRAGRRRSTTGRAARAARCRWRWPARQAARCIWRCFTRSTTITASPRWRRR